MKKKWENFLKYEITVTLDNQFAEGHHQNGQIWKFFAGHFFSQQESKMSRSQNILHTPILLDIETRLYGPYSKT